MIFFTINFFQDLLNFASLKFGFSEDGYYHFFKQHDIFAISFYKVFLFRLIKIWLKMILLTSYISYREIRFAFKILSNFIRLFTRLFTSVIASKISTSFYPPLAQWLDAADLW